MEPLHDWWQLFDAKTRRFYYYNVHNQKTVWHLPTSSPLSSSNTNTSLVALNTPHLVPLASRLVCLLIKNHALLNNTSTNDLRILYDNIRRAHDTDSPPPDDNRLHSFLAKVTPALQSAQLFATTSGDVETSPQPKSQQFDSNASKAKTNTNSIVSIPLSAAMSSLSSLNKSSSPSPATNCVNSNLRTQQQQQRRLLPRTNPNYVNVDFIDLNGGKTTIKNTYVKLQELSNRNTDEQTENANANENENCNEIANVNACMESKAIVGAQSRIITSSSHSSVFNSLKRGNISTNPAVSSANSQREDALAKKSASSLSSTTINTNTNTTSGSSVAAAASHSQNGYINSGHTNSGDLYQQATIMLLSILKNTEKGNSSLRIFVFFFHMCREI